MDKVEMYAETCKELTTLYKVKNADYGDSFSKTFQDYGMVMACVRLEDKLNRLKSLTVKNQSQQVNDESVEDTLRDMASYAIMTINELKIEKEKKTNG